VLFRSDDDGGFAGFVSIERDITWELEQRNNLARAQARAETANEAKSDFLANMSHEIRTPMTAILGYTDLLDRDTGLDAEQRSDAVRTIRRNGEHLLAIVNDILDVSKIEAGKMTIEHLSVSPVQIVEDVVTLMRVRSMGKGIDLCVEYVGELPSVISTDPTRIRQILTNLVGNSIKFTEIGGVTVRVSQETPYEKTFIRFDVIDTGIGMTEEQREAASKFNAFSQADSSVTRRFGGTGLGLRISNSLAQLLGGELTIKSELGKGSVFSFTIDPGDLKDVPVGLVHPGEGSKTVADAPAPKAKTVSNELVLQGLRILYAEDGPDNQRLISFHLKKAGAEVELEFDIENNFYKKIGRAHV